MKNYRNIAVAFGFLSFLVFATGVDAKNAKVEICHIPPGNPSNAHFITVGEFAVPAHIANHGDEVVPGDGMCSVGVGECAVDGFLACTSDGLVCDVDDDCVLAQFSDTFPPSDQYGAWDAFEAELSASTTYNQIQFFSDTDPGYTCTGPEANIICQAIRTQTNETCEFVPPVTVTCQGDTWEVGGCGGTEVSVNSDFCTCSDQGTTIRAEIASVCGGLLDVYGAVNSNTCFSSATTTMTVICQ